MRRKKTIRVRRENPRIEELFSSPKPCRHISRGGVGYEEQLSQPGFLPALETIMPHIHAKCIGLDFQTHKIPTPLILLLSQFRQLMSRRLSYIVDLSYQCRALQTKLLLNKVTNPGIYTDEVCSRTKKIVTSLVQLDSTASLALRVICSPSGRIKLIESDGLVPC